MTGLASTGVCRICGLRRGVRAIDGQVIGPSKDRHRRYVGVFGTYPE